MHAGVDSRLAQRAKEPVFVADVALDQAVGRMLRRGRDVRALGGFGVERIEGIDPDHVATFAQQALDEGRADEARGSRDENPLLARHRGPVPHAATRESLLSRDVRVHHDANQLGERRARLPAEFAFRLARVREQRVDFGRPQSRGVDAHEVGGIEAGARERDFDEFSHRVFPGSDHEVVRLFRRSIMCIALT